MSYKKHFSTLIRFPLILMAIILGGLTGCESSDDDGLGYIQLYNASSNAPDIYLTVDQYDDDDYDERTHSSISYSKVSSRLEYETDSYDIELAWQDEYNDTDDLETIYETQLQIKKDVVKFIVIAEDIQTPNVLIYDLQVRDDDERDDDNDDDLFNIRFLNMGANSDIIDIYVSESDETFNEAEIVAQSTSYTEMTTNQKMEQDDYVFYITAAGSEEILYQSKEISFAYSSEHIILIRENQGAGSSPFIIDLVSTSTSTEVPDATSDAEYKIYNGIIEHELLPSYYGVFDVYIDNIDDSAEISSLAFSEMSDSMPINFGDYGISLTNSDTNEPLIENHLFSLSENSDKTIFFYLLEEDVDEDDDGDVDEDGDGYVDEIEITLNSLVVDNSQGKGIYNHNINVINLIDDDDFTFVDVYFVLNDEIVETADNSIVVPYITPKTINLLNNTYSVYIIGNDDSSDIILNSFELTLTEDSKEQFLILEKDSNSVTGYKALLADQ